MVASQAAGKIYIKHNFLKLMLNRNNRQALPVAHFVSVTGRCTGGGRLSLPGRYNAPGPAVPDARNTLAHRR